MAAALLGGCRQEEPSAYRAPKDGPSHHHHRADAPPSLPAAPPSLAFSLPEGWVEQPTTSQMQSAHILVSGSDGASARVTAVPLPDIMDNELQVVNLWRETLGLEPVTDDGLAGLKQPATIAGQEGVIYDMITEEETAEGRERIAVGVVTQDGLSWFFKLTGPDEFVGAQSDNFRAFLASIEFKAAPPPAAAPASPPQRDLPDWTVPEAWSEQPPGNMLLASFDADGAAVTVSSFGGNLMGGLLANVNRWRRQVGLGPTTESELDSMVTPLSAPAEGARLVDIAGETSRVMVAMAARPNSTWFFKILGPTATVDQQRAAFLAFVESVDFSND